MKKITALLFGLALLAVGCSDSSDNGYAKLSKYAIRRGTAVIYTDGSRFQGNEVFERLSEFLKEELGDKFDAYTSGDANARVLGSASIDDGLFVVVVTSEKFSTFDELKGSLVEELSKQDTEFVIADTTISDKRAVTITTNDNTDSIAAIECEADVFAITTVANAGAYLASEKGVAPELAEVVEPLKGYPAFMAGIKPSGDSSPVETFTLVVDLPDKTSATIASDLKFSDQKALENAYIGCTRMVSMFSVLISQKDPELGTQLMRQVKFTRDGESLKGDATIDVALFAALESFVENMANNVTQQEGNPK